jgi:hypothetical protein
LALPPPPSLDRRLRVPEKARGKASVLRISRAIVLGGFVMKSLLGNLGFTISILIVVVVAVIFVFLFNAPAPLVGSMLVLGAFTAVLEHILHSRNTSR